MGGFGRDFSALPAHRRAILRSAPAERTGTFSVDALSMEGEEILDPYLDQVPAAPPAPAVPAAPAALATPTDLQQILTSWVPGPSRYGFQLKFQCRSSSGDVRDLQSQAPNLIWREYVTYSRNDFSHRISPPDPTILPATGGVSFAPASTTRRGTNLLEFNGVTDTHWTPTSAVRAGDFQTAPLPPGFMGPPLRPLPAIMESSQVYQYSPDGGSTWSSFAGPFSIRRTLFSDSGTLRFRTEKSRVHSVTEPYKP
jgi:hypothetical protein